MGGSNGVRRLLCALVVGFVDKVDITHQTDDIVNLPTAFQAT